MDASGSSGLNQLEEGRGQVTIRRPSRGFVSLGLGEVWAYRDLLQLMIWRNTIVRYKQSVVGIGWAVFRPLIQMVIFSIIFGRLAKLPTPGQVPYTIFTYVALLPWTYFAAALTGASNSLVDSAGMATKVYFPRVILPLSNVVAGLIDFAVAFAVLAVMMFWYRDRITVVWSAVACLPLFLALAVASAFGAGLWLSALMVKYRDVKHVLPFLIQCWMYVTPVAYTAELVPDRWRLVYGLNPMAGVIDGFRWALLGRSQPHWGGLAASAAVATVMLLAGLCYFRRVERTYADIV